MLQYKTYFEEAAIRYSGSKLPVACYAMQNQMIMDPFYTISPNWHNEMELLYSEAEISLYINDECLEIVPGDIVFINPWQIHRASRKTYGKIYSIVFDLNLLKLPDSTDPVNCLIDDIISQKQCFSTKPERDTELYRIIVKLFESASEYCGKQVGYGSESYTLLSCLYAFMSACLTEDFFEPDVKNKRDSMNSVMEIIRYINDHYQELITAEILSRQLNLCQTYLYSLFRNYVGITPMNYINSVRLQQAYRLLEQGKNVTETAAGVGFQNVSYFIKLFKTATGQTPLQWSNRKNSKNVKRRK